MKKRDLTNDKIFSNLMFMTIPAILGHLSRSVYDIVDMFWIGKISASAVAAVTVLSSILWLIWILSSVIGNSSVSLISQSFGKGDKERAARVIEQTITFKIIVALITMAIVLPLLKNLVSFITTDQEVISLALKYGYVRIAFLPILFAQATLSVAIRCVGDSKRAMKVMLFSAILNIFLDPIMMFDTIPLIGIKGFGLGIAGAAWATNIANLLGVILGMYYLLSGKTNIKIKFSKMFKLIPEIDKKLVTIGAPLGLEMLSREGAGFIVMKLVASYGPSALAAVGITFRVLSISFIIFLGFGDGAGAIVGQNLGVNNIKTAEKVAKLTGFISSGVNFIMFLIIFLFTPQIIGIFTQSTEVLYYGSILVRFMAFSYAIFSYSFGLSSAFFGSGYNQPFMYASIFSRWIVQVPLMFIIVKVLGLPFIAVAIGYSCAEITEALALMYYFHQGRWKETKVVAI
ncbi:MAG: MATE family efflux transporter [Clostridia bacterium]